MTAEEKERVRRYVERLNARYRTLKAQVDEDLEPYRNLTPEQTSRIAASVVATSALVLRGMPPDQRRRIMEPDPPAPDFDRIWKRLVARYRTLPERHVR